MLVRPDRTGGGEVGQAQENVMETARILVVEDDGIIALGLSTTLQRLGYGVLATAACGQDAIDKVAEGHPDLVLMDIRLKGPMDGI